MSISQPAHMKYRADIDGLRAVAILSVIFYHAFPEKIPGGFIGVDIFFVISGFLISTIIFSNLERNRFSLVDFYVRRIRRIFPSLLLVLIATFVFGWFVLFADEYKQLGKHTAAGAGFVQNFILWSESGYFDELAETKPLLHLWSLAIEEQFYIFWPLLLVVVWKRWSFLKITSIVAAISLAASIYYLNRDSTSAFYLPVPRFWELMLGGILAYVVLHHPKLIGRYKNAQSALGFLLLLTGLMLLNRERDFPGWWAMLPTLGAFFIISANGGWLNEKLLSNKLMVWFGLISYPLYLWHWPLLTYLKIVEGEVSALSRIAALCVAAVLAWLSFRFVERPIRFGGNPRTRAVFLMGVMVVVGLVGAYGANTGGFPWRIINGVQVSTEKYDFATNYRSGKCFLGGKADKQFDEVCDGGLPGKPTVVLWGDSHAASLYRGLLKQTAMRGINLAQYTMTGCPPVIDFDVDNRKSCKSINASVFTRIKKTHPDTVILSAYWLLYDGKHDESGKPWNSLPEKKISDTILALKSFGIRNIVIVGQLPVFNQSQTKIAFRSFVPGVSSRTYKGYIQESSVANSRLRQVAVSNRVAFVSPIDTLCNEAGCLISTSLEKMVPLAWDYGHLTSDGSEFLIEAALINKTLWLPERN